MDCIVCLGKRVRLELLRKRNSWLTLQFHNCSVCLARGRNYTVPPSTLIENCDHWHISDIADSRDGPMNSITVLRRNLVGLLMNRICQHFSHVIRMNFSRMSNRTAIITVSLIQDLRRPNRTFSHLNDCNCSPIDDAIESKR